MLIETNAWHWQQSENPADLVLKKTSIYPLADDQVLIENKAIGLNPVDWKVMAGFGNEWPYDKVFGVDGMGVVVAVGKGMQHIRLGTRYAYHTTLSLNGSFSHHTVVSGKALIAVPDQLTDEVAAAFPCPGLTAWQAFQKVPHVAGENILVNGAGGSVGSILTQLLIDAGAKVYVTASPHRHPALINRGAIGAFDYRDNNWQHTLSTQLGTQSIYAIYDTVNGKSASALAKLLGYYGHLVCIQDRIEQAPLAAFTTSISLHEIALASIHAFGTNKQWAQLVNNGEQLLAKVANKNLTLPPIEVIKFDEIPAALTRLKQDNNGIKYVATLA